MRVTFYLFKELIRQGLNAKSVILSALAVLGCILFLSGFWMIVSQGALFGSVQIIAILKEEAALAEINQLYLEIRSWTEVASLKYVPKEAVKSRRFEIALKDPEDAPSVAASLQGFSPIETVLAPKPSSLNLYLQKIPQREAVVWGTLSFLLLISMGMIRWALRSLMKSFKGQIEILKLAGVSPATIRSPFVFMGILYGLLGALGAVLLFYLVLEANGLLVMALATAGFGILLGALGSWLSLRLGGIKALTT